jgi:tetratricopeptide (TPR) repeat protein
MKCLARLAVSVMLSLTLLLVGCQSKYMTSGKVYLNTENYEKAAEQFELATQNEPKNGDAFGYLAITYGKLRRYEDAGKMFGKAAELGAKDKRIAEERSMLWAERFNLGANQAKAEEPNWQAVADRFREAVAIDGTRPDGHRNLAVALSRLGRMDEAAESYDKALSLMKRGSEPWLEVIKALAVIRFNQGDLDAALELAQRTLEAVPADPEATSQIALILDRQGKTEEAVAAYDEAIAARPDDKNLYYNRGVLYANKEMFEKGIPDFEKTVEIDPEDSDGWYNLGVAYVKLERFEEAVTALEKATMLDPNSPEAWYYLGVSYFKVGRDSEASEAFDEAEKLSGE